MCPYFNSRESQSLCITKMHKNEFLENKYARVHQTVYVQNRRLFNMAYSRKKTRNRRWLIRPDYKTRTMLNLTLELSYRSRGSCDGIFLPVRIRLFLAVNWHRGPWLLNKWFEWNRRLILHFFIWWIRRESFSDLTRHPNAQKHLLLISRARHLAEERTYSMRNWIIEESFIKKILAKWSKII